MRKPYFIPMNLQLFAEGDDDHSSEVKTFTQEEVDRIVGERLGREKAKYADYEDLKELVPIIQEFGYEGTPAEIKAVLRAEAEGRRKQAELQYLQKEAELNGTSPELLAEIKALKGELAEIKQEKQASKQELEAKQQAEQAWNTQVEDFSTKHPDIDIPKLAENKKFMRFLDRSNPKLSLVEVYEDFIELHGAAEADAIAKIKSNLDRSTSSGRSKGEASGGTYGLTPQQQALAEENGMSLKDYADLLKNVRR